MKALLLFILFILHLKAKKKLTFNNQPDTVGHRLHIGGQRQKLAQQDRLDGIQEDVGRAAQK